MSKTFTEQGYKEAIQKKFMGVLHDQMQEIIKKAKEEAIQEAVENYETALRKHLLNVTIDLAKYMRMNTAADCLEIVVQFPQNKVSTKRKSKDHE